MGEILAIVEGAISFMLAIWFTIWLLILLPAEMARNRNRSAFWWVVVSLAISPFAAIFLLWLIGPAADHP